MNSVESLFIVFLHSYLLDACLIRRNKRHGKVLLNVACYLAYQILLPYLRQRKIAVL